MAVYTERYRRLQLGSAHAGQCPTGLFLEVLMIRWVTSEVPVFAYFKNIVLIGCFLGFGLGSIAFAAGR